MGRRSKKPVQTDEELALTMRDSKRRSSLYGGRSETAEVNNQRISQIVSLAAAELAATMDPDRRIALHDTAAVETAILRYLRICADESIIPSLTGLASSCGHSRSSVYMFMRAHPDSPTTEVLRNYSEMIAEILSQASLSGATAAIPSIFVLKARHGFRDDAVNELPEPPKETLNAKEIMEKYDLPD